MIIRDMNRYEHGKIYKIVDVGYNKCYIGSTCEELSQRMARHRSSYMFYLKSKTHKSKSFDIFDEYGIENCKIEWIEDYPCNSKKELEAREGQYIEHTNCVNRVMVGRTPHEYKQYYNPLNKDKIKTGLKEWYERTKEERKPKHKEYYESHKAEARERAKVQKECNICGCVVSQYKMKRHQQSKKYKSCTSSNS